jgi:hypothetical protein
MSAGVDAGLSKYSGRRSRPLLCFLRNYLQSSPLKVRVISVYLTSCEKLEVTEKSKNDPGTV